MFEKVNTIPYSIRQFCKCLYQLCKNKFGDSIKLIRVVAFFLLEKWLLKSIFFSLNKEGLIKDYILTKNCTTNLELMS